MEIIKSIGVFCGSSKGSNGVYELEAKKMGKAIASRDLRMIYGGGNIGLMGVIADSMIEEKAEVTGVIPGLLMDKELAHPGVQDMRIVSDMAERKKVLYDLSDAFITMPGGFGSMDEFFEMLTYFQLQISSKPCAILNTHGYYNGLIEQMKHFRDERFLREEHLRSIIIDDDPERLIERLINFKNQPPHEKWIDELKDKDTY